MTDRSWWRFGSVGLALLWLGGCTVQTEPAAHTLTIGGPAGWNLRLHVVRPSLALFLRELPIHKAAV